MSASFDDRSDVYEAMVDWNKRLAHEWPFYQRIFVAHKVKSVIDVACGTGHHVHHFARQGLRAVGADISPVMLEKAKSRFGESESLSWINRSFTDSISPAGAFDGALCVGNSLALAGSKPAASQVVANMLTAVRVGGVVIIHLPNLWRLPDGPVQWQKNIRARIQQNDVLILKGMHRAGANGFVDLVVAPIDPAAGKLRTESVPFMGLEESDLRDFASLSSTVQFFGGYNDEPYDRQTSADLIMVAVK